MNTDGLEQMNLRMSHRLAALRQEYTVGGEQLRALEVRQRELQNTLLRIDGAIQMLEELTQPPPDGAGA